MTGMVYITDQNGDDWRMVYGIVLPTFFGCQMVIIDICIYIYTYNRYYKILLFSGQNPLLLVLERYHVLSPWLCKRRISSTPPCNSAAFWRRRPTRPRNTWPAWKCRDRFGKFLQVNIAMEQMDENCHFFDVDDFQFTYSKWWMFRYFFNYVNIIWLHNKM